MKFLVVFVVFLLSTVCFGNDPLTSGVEEKTKQNVEICPSDNPTVSPRYDRNNKKYLEISWTGGRVESRSSSPDQLKLEIEATVGRHECFHVSGYGNWNCTSDMGRKNTGCHLVNVKVSLSKPTSHNALTVPNAEKTSASAP